MLFSFGCDHLCTRTTLGKKLEHVSPSHKRQTRVHMERSDTQHTRLNVHELHVCDKLYLFIYIVRIMLSPCVDAVVILLFI